MKAAILALLLAGCVSHVPTHNELRATTLTLRFERGLCSGTAIAPNIILTARHCTEGGVLKMANNQPVVVTRTSIGSTDRIEIEVSAPRFEHFAKVGGMPVQGDRIRLWGNPVGAPDIYREGRVVNVSTDGIVIDAYACLGDSGAALFNDAGLIVGVLHGITVPVGNTPDCRFTTATGNP